MHRPTLLALLLTLVATPGDAIELPFFNRDKDEAVAPADKPGGRNWWRTHGKKAEFVPGSGYRVPGYGGFFDRNGVPIDASVDEQAIQFGVKQEEGSGLLPGLDPRAAVESVREAAGFGPDRAVAEALLAEGVAQFERKQYGAASKSFESAASRWPGTDLAAKALFNLGETHYFADDYKEASDAYVELLDKHPSTPRLDDAVERLWSIAQYWERTYFDDAGHAPFDYQPFSKTRPTFDTIGHAVRMYEAIRLNDPTGPRADDAIMAEAGIHFRRRRFADADYHYTLLRREYPRSEHQFEAHLLGLQAKMRRYQGADYDGTPLVEAKRLEEQTRVNFAGRLSEEEQSRLATVRAEIAASIEGRDLRMAAYYEGAKHVDAARYYLARVVAEHPGSPSAEKAQERLAALEGKPGSPEEPMKWLVEWLPENRQYESINSIREITPTDTIPGDGKTLVADGSAGEGETTTR